MAAILIIILIIIFIACFAYSKDLGTSLGITAVSAITFLEIAFSIFLFCCFLAWLF